jgi:hypothetical protein
MVSCWSSLLGAVASLMLGAACGGADAGAYVVSATFNGAPTTSVTLGAEINIVVTV